MLRDLADTPRTLVDLWPAWVAITAAALVVLNQLLTESEKFANLLGRLGRTIYARARRRYQMDQIEFSQAVRDAVNAERERWERDEARALTVVEGQMEIVSGLAADQQTQLKELSFQLGCMRAYVEYEAEWHHRLRLRLLSAQNEGAIKLDDLPEHMLYFDFENRCRKVGNLSWRTWGVI